jgi:hypothetical protein
MDGEYPVDIIVRFNLMALVKFYLFRYHLNLLYSTLDEGFREV